MIPVQCPRCNQAIEVSDFLAGFTVVCKSCKGRVDVPRHDKPADGGNIGDPVVPAESPSITPSDVDGAETASTTDARFRILRPHAKGGLGLVSVAHDGELNREVALKEIQECHADDNENRSRFLVEAEITGRLEHPGVVPVYGLGHYDDGRPFYAMRLIKGDSLKDALDRFHKAASYGRDPSEQSFELRQLLTRFIAVCHTIQYAHDRGILHRDLKPSNIMLGRYGETLVVDWGVAKVIGRDETRKPSSDVVDEPTLRPASSANAAETKMGSAVGTPQYMSPEQAAGRLDELGPPSDVYNLGATLYSILTGESPVPLDDPAVMLDKVKRGDIPRPRLHKPNIDPALEAVCSKAMALNPADRYATPHALADDVERWLADEPVGAWPEPWTVKARRWMDKHRTLMTGTAAALVVLVAALGVLAVVMTSAYETEKGLSTELKKANEGEKAALAKANEKAREARDQEHIATKNATEANEQRKKAIAQTMRAESELAKSKMHFCAQQMSFALKEWEAGRAPQATGRLENVPPDLRGWEYDYLVGLFDSDHTILRGHGGVEAKPKPLGLGPFSKSPIENQAPSVSLSFSSDGKHLVGELGDSQTRLWNLDFKQGVTLPGGYHVASDRIWYYRNTQGAIYLSSSREPAKTRILKSPVRLLANIQFSANGERIVAIGAFATLEKPLAARVFVWNLEEPGDDDEPLEPLELDGQYRAPVFDPTGRKLAVGSGTEIHVWDVTEIKNKNPTVLKGHKVGVTKIRFTADSEKLISLAGTEVWEWDISDTLKPTGKRIFAGVAMNSCDCDGCVAFSDGLSTRVIDLKGPKVIEPLLLKGPPQGKVTAVAVNPSRSLIATAAQEKALLWSVSRPANGPTTVLATYFLIGHTDDILGVRFNHNGTLLATYAKDMTIRLWDPRTGNLLRTLVGHSNVPGAIAFEPNGQRLVSASKDGTMRIWNVTPQEKKLKKKLPVAAGNQTYFSPDGRLVVTERGFSGPPSITDLDDGRVIEIKTGSTRFSGMSISPNRQWFAGRNTSGIQVWDLANAKPKGRDGIEGRQFHSSYRQSKDKADINRELIPVGPIGFSPNSKLLYSATADNAVRLWDVESGNERVLLKGHTNPISAVGFSLNCERLATGDRVVPSKNGKPMGNSTVRVWSVDDGAMLREFPVSTSAVLAVALSPRGDWMAFANDNRINLWSVNQREEGVVLPGHTDAITALTFTHDGRRLISASKDGTLRFWDVPTGVETYRFTATPVYGAESDLATMPA